MRFRPVQHLSRQSDIQAVRQQGHRVDCRAFTLWTLERTQGTPLARACFVASTQAVGGAVLRNRAKRRLREIFRRHQDVVPKSRDYLLVARAQVNLWPMPQLEGLFTGACGRIASAPTRNP